MGTPTRLSSKKAAGVYDRSKYSLRKVRLNAGGYDENGQYFGANDSVNGELYFAENKEDGIGEHLRARTRNSAIQKMNALIADGKLEERRKSSWWPWRR